MPMSTVRGRSRVISQIECPSADEPLTVLRSESSLGREVNERRLISPLKETIT